MLVMSASINLGDRVYLKIAVAGEPGYVSGFDHRGRALVDWSADMPEIGRLTAHDLDTLIIDEGFTVRQLDLFESDEVAA
jgi:hypothetical protein